jgi:crotonobetainyl-CoA:carnitine CoA-transferase CaiB-like acyl-CoA transferase
MPGPLEGIRVVEIANYVAVPAAGTLLADLGADVVKVEVPWGDFYRFATPRRNGYESDFPLSANYQMDNRGKRSVALDLALPQSVEALRRLIDRADVLITNTLPGRLAKIGLDVAALCEARPELIVARLGGFSPDGPQADDPGFDQTCFWALSGMMDQQRDPDSPPAFFRPGVGDHCAALSMTTGILAALRDRDRTGRGQIVDVNLQQVGFYIGGNDSAQALATGRPPPRHDRRAPRNPLWNHYPTADDRWLLLVMIDSTLYWPSFARAIERPDLLEDPRFRDPKLRFQHNTALVETLDATFRRRTLAEWTTALEGEKVIWAPARTVLEAVNDPRAHANGCFSTIQHPEHGSFETVAPPFRLSRHAMHGTFPAPDLNAHTREVLEEAGVEPELVELLVSVAEQ